MFSTSGSTSSHPCSSSRFVGSLPSLLTSSSSDLIPAQEMRSSKSQLVLPNPAVPSSSRRPARPGAYVDIFDATRFLREKEFERVTGNRPQAVFPTEPCYDMIMWIITLPSMTFLRHRLQLDDEFFTRLAKCWRVSLSCNPKSLALSLFVRYQWDTVSLVVMKYCKCG